MTSVRQALLVLVLMSMALAIGQIRVALAFFSGGIAVIAALTLHLLYIRPEMIRTPAHFWLRMCRGQVIKGVAVALLWWQALQAYSVQAFWVWLGGTCGLFIYQFMVLISTRLLVFRKQ